MASPRVRHVLATATTLGAVLLTAACGGSPTAAPAAQAKPLAQPTAAAVPTATVAVDDASAAAPTASNLLKATEVGDLGQVVTDAEGFTLYRFDKDTAKPPKSNCADACAATWPPATVAEDVQTEGIDKNLVGTLDRPDGTKQLTIGGWPMYRYAKDTKPGDVTGEAVGGTWFAAAPTGGKAKDRKAAAAAGTTVIRVMDVKPFGKVLTDGQGFTLYRFEKDTVNPSKSNCAGDCAVTWPVVKAEDNIVAEGVDKSLVGSVTRSDGTKQLTVGGWPMYRYIKDTAVCDTKGEGVGGVWFVAAPNGKKAKDAVKK